MNYIPGFSNYLETSMPRYADGGPVMDDPRRAAVMPMTTEAVAPYDLSGLAGLDLSGLNFGTDFGGGAMGGQYQADPNLQYIAAPLSNKGNPTSQTGGNTFAVKADQPVRLVDNRTNQVVFEGAGFDAARKATELGQGLTDALGRKANYSIQTADPTGNYSTVAYEKKNKSTLGTIADVAGTALPLAMIPLTMGMSAPLAGLSTAGKIALGAGVGGLSSGLKGDNILKGAAIGGLSAAGGSLLPKIPAIGDLGRLAQPLGVGVGSTVGNLATGQNLKNSLLSGVASGTLAYLTPDIQAALRGAQGSGVSVGGDTSVSTNSGPAPIATVTGNTGFSPTVSIGGGSSSPRQVIEEPPAATVIGNPAVPGAVVNYTGGGGDEITPEYLPREEILVKARPSYTPTAQITGGLDLPQDLLTDIDQMSEAERKAEDERKKLGVSDYLRLGGLAAGLIGSAAGGGGSRQTGTYGGTGSGRLNPIFSAKLPAAGGLGNIGMNRTLRPLGDVDWLTYGTRPELNFFDYSPRTAPAPVTQPAAPAPVTQPVPNNPAGPAMYVPDDMRFAEGGAFAAKRGGSSKRTEFAVNGPGTGRSDEIPAVLSDGEYVIDAETVALLGDGSSKAGAKKLDDLRVKVRKHKGEKLAKGRFSANAKNPEAYLSGGRV